jgi:hypothetical protein
MSPTKIQARIPMVLSPPLATVRFHIGTDNIP